MTAVDVAVVGGGIAGTSTAAFLAEAGLRVRLYERAAIASGASGRNSGVVQHPFDPALAGLYRATLTEYEALAAASDGTFRMPDEPAGLLYVGRDRELATRTAAAWQAAWPDARAELVEGASLATLEPALASDLIACRLAIGYPIAPAAATEAFARLARRRGVEIVVGGDVRPAIAQGRVTGVTVAGRLNGADSVVVAAGPWTPRIIDPTGAWRPIASSWGVVAGLALADAPRHALEAIDIAIEPDDGPGGTRGDADASAHGGGDAQKRPATAAAPDDAVEFSLVPAAASSALGSTFLPREPDPAAWLGALRRVGARYVPGLAAAPLVGLRHCARPVSRDGRPLVGAAPWADGLWIHAGHGPWGISTGPGSARLLVDAILAGRTRVAPGRDQLIPASFRADRFGAPGSGG